jgi:hypothetical protein
MTEYESDLKEKLLSNKDSRNWNALQTKHQQMIRHMQHERLIHLMVTLAFGLFLLISLAIVSIRPNLQSFMLTGLFFALLVPYVLHYFFLENTIQRWYQMMDEIAKHMKSPEQ